MVLLPLLLVWLRSPMVFPRYSQWVLLGVFVASLSVKSIVLVAQIPDAAIPSSNAQPNSPSVYDSSGEQMKRRQGTLLASESGRVFQSAGRWVFVADSNKHQYAMLENLALERVTRAIREEPTDNRWTVNGELTEYMGKNYLLLKIIKRASAEHRIQSAS